MPTPKVPFDDNFARLLITSYDCWTVLAVKLPIDPVFLVGDDAGLFGGRYNRREAAFTGELVVLLLLFPQHAPGIRVTDYPRRSVVAMLKAIDVVFLYRHDPRVRVSGYSSGPRITMFLTIDMILLVGNDTRIWVDAYV